jgi:phospholipid transport system substrate-binding protein
MISRQHKRPLAAGIIGAVLVGSLLAATLALAPFTTAHAQVGRNPQAEQFVQFQAQRIIGVLNNRTLSSAQRIRTFGEIVNEIADIPRITTFVLGKYARTITPGQMQRFGPIFRQYEQNVYETRLSDFHGQTVTVTGSVARQADDVIVNTLIGGGGLQQPLPVAWRVLGGDARWKVVDVQVNGIWLAITQQQDFVSTIDNHGGAVDALISQLQQQTEQQTNARPQ